MNDDSGRRSGALVDDALGDERARDEDGTRVGLNRVSNPNKPPFVGDFFSVSVGANWTPRPNVTIRPEVRYDWYDGDPAAALPFDDGTDGDQLMLGVDVILVF